MSLSNPAIPTIIQFGASSPLEFSRASSLAAPYVSGVDLNCGCPLSWACAESLGAALMNRREVVAEMVTETRKRLERDGYRDTRTVSVKIRVHRDLRYVNYVTSSQGWDAFYRLSTNMTLWLANLRMVGKL
jgi:tRNA-dihydrouridine synthase 4